VNGGLHTPINYLASRFMENDLNESTSSMLPIALAVLAIVLGGAGLYFGMSANQRINPISDNIEASSSSAARIEKQLGSFDTKLTELVVQTDELKQTVNRLRVYSSQSEQAAKQAISGVKDNREELVKLVTKFNELATSGISTGPRQSTATTAVAPSAPSSTLSANSDAATLSSTVAASTYSIQSGDNFAKIASKKGISLQALLDANSSVDPRRLQIGQEIRIPSN